MGEHLLWIIKGVLIIISADLLLGLFCGTIFGAYFRAKENHMRRVFGRDKTDGK